MSANDVLNQDEIDALLGGGVAEDIEVLDKDSPQIFDFGSQDRIVRGRMPTLEMINERFARNMRSSFFSVLRKHPEITSTGVKVMKFGEYIHTLFMPASINLIKVNPLKGSGIFLFDAKLVYILVDNFFGGEGKFHTKIEGREFTATENRIIKLLLDKLFVDSEEAWAPVYKVKYQYINSEVNPAMANIVTPSEVIVISTFRIELEGGGGDIHIALPYSTIEPIRELLDSGVQSDRIEADERWSKSLREEIMDARVKIHANLGNIELKLSELSSIKAGDIIPFEMPDAINVYVNGIATFRGVLGTKQDRMAIKISEKVRRPQ